MKTEKQSAFQNAFPYHVATTERFSFNVAIFANWFNKIAAVVMVYKGKGDVGKSRLE